MSGANGTAPDRVVTVTDAQMDALSKARKTFGLDAVPTAARRRDVLRAARADKKALLDSIGTPGDVARAMMRKPLPAEWERDLRAISPIMDGKSHLRFAWKEPPGKPDDGRWTIYECTPAPLVRTERLMELESPPFWTLATPAERHAQAQVVSAYQWLMYREHRLDVRPFWCLQGSEGGTPFHLSNIEVRYLRMMGLPDYPLPLGALPYAPWDERTKRQVLERDRLYRFGASAGQGTPESKAAEERLFRQRFFDWFSEKMGPQSELMAWCASHEDADKLYARQTREEAMAAADARDVFIETGRLPDPSDYKKRSP